MTRELATFFAVNLCTGIAVLLGSSSVCAEQVRLARPISENLLQESGQRFHPVHSSLGIVSSQERLASEVGAFMLRKGGNAMDAAVATAFALSVTLPQAGNLGGGGFLVFWHAPERKAYALNFREMAPHLAHRDLFLDADGEVSKNKEFFSLLSTGVPGSVAGLLKAQERFGRLSRVEVMAPSIQLADEGFVIYPQLADSLKRAFPRLSKDPTARSLFYRQVELPDGGPQSIPYQSGEQLRQPELAQSLKLISSKGTAGFYEGTTAHQIVALMKSQGGLIDYRDLTDFTAPWVEPVKGIFRDHTVISMPPPSSGGITLLQILRLIEPFDLESLGANSADSIHLLTESMNLAYRDRNQFLGDPDQIDIPIRRLLSHSYIDSLRNQLNLSSHTSAVDLAGQAPLSSGVNTTHLSVADRDGSLVALTTTLNFAYGNGIAVPGAGFLLNNELADFTAKPGVPNAYGLVQGEQNAVAPSRRPLSSMTPTIVLNQEGDSWLATGSPGGSRIITTVVQVLLNRIIHGLNLATSVATPRIHSQLWPDSLQLEQGFSPDTLELLKQRGHALRFTRSMGSANSVELKPNGGSFGVADPRRPEGAAIAE
ncbi:gamma-glutamyltransferase [Synechococcus sp. AH-551-B05]|nr:gamma-glutamyltransferase [Synechococcus sp. AH-551-B05]MDB4677276.1 gamma-glutamyltransferase [Synechococcus sp. AH-551-B05]